MRYKISALLAGAITVTIISIASAQAPPSDSLGIFYDLNATTVEGHFPPSVPFFMYIILLGPTSNEVSGFEFGYNFSGVSLGSIYRLANTLPPGSVDSGDNQNILSGDYIISLAEPIPSEQLVVLVQWQLMLLTNLYAWVELGPSRPESLPDGLPAYDSGSSIVPMQLVESCAGSGQAIINMYCGVAESAMSFGRVKSLFR